MYANTKLMDRKRIWLSLAAAMLLSFGLAYSQTALASQHSGDSDCRFVLGFRELHDLIPHIVGDCLENEQHDIGHGHHDAAHDARGYDVVPVRQLHYVH